MNHNFKLDLIQSNQDCSTYICKNCRLVKDEWADKTTIYYHTYYIDGKFAASGDYISCNDLIMKSILL